MYASASPLEALRCPSGRRMGVNERKQRRELRELPVWDGCGTANRVHLQVAPVPLTTPRRRAQLTRHGRRSFAGTSRDFH
jgi:hypothetical protein